jgi:hypothetical protein
MRTLGLNLLYSFAHFSYIGFGKLAPEPCRVIVPLLLELLLPKGCPLQAVIKIPPQSRKILMITLRNTKNLLINKKLTAFLTFSALNGRFKL